MDAIIPPFPIPEGKTEADAGFQEQTMLTFYILVRRQSNNVTMHIWVCKELEQENWRPEGYFGLDDQRRPLGMCR